MELWRRARSVTVVGKRTVWRTVVGLKEPNTPVTRSPALSVDPRLCAVQARVRAVTTTAAITKAINVVMTMDVGERVSVTDVESSVHQVF